MHGGAYWMNSATFPSASLLLLYFSWIESVFTAEHSVAYVVLTRRIYHILNGIDDTDKFT